MVVSANGYRPPVPTPSSVAARLRPERPPVTQSYGVHPVSSPPFSPVWRSLGIRAGHDVVGHVMWVYDEEDGNHWTGGRVMGALTATEDRGGSRAACRYR